MVTVRVYDNDNLIALQDLDTDDIEGCEFSKKFRAETSLKSRSRQSHLCPNLEEL